MKNFKGIFTALLTPFDCNDRINRTSLEQLIKMNLKAGVTGFYVGGSTGEAFLMNESERKELLKIVKEAAPESTLIAHIGSINEREAISLGKYAKYLEYDAISSVAPFYYKFSFEEIKNYYYRIAEISELPMLVYNFPSFSGVNMGIDEFRQFLSSDKFLGLKHTSQDFFSLEQCKTNFPDKFIYNGFDEMCLAGLSMGADGAIGSTYNFMADKFVEIYKLFGEERLKEAYEIQKEANRIISVLSRIGVMQGEKEILNQMGFSFGHCRTPFSELSDEQKNLIKEEIVKKL